MKNLGNVPEENLDDVLMTMHDIISRVSYEAKYTGDMTWRRKFIEFYNAFSRERSKRINIKVLGE
jgi:hypothetical protein